jgi:hypothetical protein
MMGGRRVMTEDLAEALTNFVGADIRLRAAASTGDKFEKRVAEWDAAAAQVARRARAAGLVPEGT